MLQFVVDAKRCTRCGLCALDCPSEIIKQENGALPAIAPDQEENCLQCQHCLAICPTAAVSIFGKTPERSLPLSAGGLPSPDAMMRLVRGRRSVRHYKDENADPALIRALLAALANAPTGVNQRELTFTVIDDKAAMQRFRVKALETLREAAAAGRVPERLDFLHDAIKLWFEKRVDFLFRGAPHMLIASAPPDAPCPGEDVPLALAYFELLAQSAGLGTVWCGLAKMLLEAVPELKPVLGLPPGHVYYCMMFGPPAIRYARTVQRDEAAVVRRVAV